MTTERFHVRSLDPEDGTEGDGVVIGPDGEFTIGPVGPGPGTFVLGNGVTTLSSTATEPPDPAEGDLRFNPDGVLTPTPAADITIDDAAFTNIVGTDVQTAMESIDGQLGATSAPSTYREVLMASGVTPPEPLESSDGGDWLYGEVPL